MSAIHPAVAEFQERAYRTQSELQAVRTQIALRKRDKKLGEVTEGQLKEQVGGDLSTLVWQGVGKMFMSVDAGTYVKSLEKESKDVDEQVKALEKKEAYLESTLKNLTEALTEIIKRSEGAASK